jgi:hypothetical protein
LSFNIFDFDIFLLNIFFFNILSFNILDFDKKLGAKTYSDRFASAAGDRGRRVRRRLRAAEGERRGAWHRNLQDGARAHAPGTGLPDFSWHNIPKRGKIYKITTKLPNWYHGRTSPDKTSRDKTSRLKYVPKRRATKHCPTKNVAQQNVAFQNIAQR